MSSDSVIGLITVRTSSSRLPAKCLLPFGEMNVIEHIIRRAQFFGIEPIVCTSTDNSDDILEKIAEKEGVRCFRGSLSNKLKRWSDCAKYYGLERFHSVDADDPFFDTEEMKRSYRLSEEGAWDVVCPTKSSSAGGASVGYTLTAAVAERAVANLPDECDTEMMWYYLDKIPNLKKIILSEAHPNPLTLRLTLDYSEDYWLLESVRRMVGNFATHSEIEALFIRNPDLFKINWFRNQEWKAAQLAKEV